ncbi:MAG: hypothetical protein LKJ18_03800 [Ancrocorticia sp.]|nr:hypothetical protein [Ancrocorticia sp.]
MRALRERVGRINPRDVVQVGLDESIGQAGDVVGRPVGLPDELVALAGDHLDTDVAASEVLIGWVLQLVLEDQVAARDKTSAPLQDPAGVSVVLDVGVDESVIVA